MRRLSWREMLMSACVAVCGLGLQACSTTGETVALTAAGVAGAGWIGSQVATHSKIDVEVEVFNESLLTQRNPENFQQAGPLAVRDLVKPVDPVLQPSVEGFIRVVALCGPIVDKMKKTRSGIQQSVDNLTNGVQARLQGPLKPVVDYVTGAKNGIDATIEAWSGFATAVTKAAANSSGVTPDELVRIAGRLIEVRRCAAERTGSPPPDVLNFIRQSVEESMTGDEPNSDARAKYRKRIAGMSAEAKRDTDQISLAICYAAISILESNATEAAKKAGIDRVAQVANLLGFETAAEDLRAAYIKADAAASVAAMRSKLSGSDVIASVLQAAQLQASVYDATFGQIQTGFNLGGIRNEVMQALLTSAATVDITRPENQQCWQKYSHAWSEGRAGNHDAVIYFEHLGMPILKSAGFDPTKFVVASGQMFRKAFSAMAAVYGVQAPNAASGPSGTSPLSAYNVKAAQDNRQAQLKAAADTQGQLISSISKIAAAGKTVNDAVAAQDMAKAKSEAANGLSDAIKALEKAKPAQ